jgi:phosphoglucomutase
VTPEQKAQLEKLSLMSARELGIAGEPVLRELTPGKETLVGGLKVIAKTKWLAPRPSRTENIYKTYAELFRNPSPFGLYLEKARQIVND